MVRKVIAVLLSLFCPGYSWGRKCTSNSDYCL